MERTEHRLGAMKKEMDPYTRAVTSIECPRDGCDAPIGKRCNTSAIVHSERRKAAIAQELWDPEKAIDVVRATRMTVPLEALRKD